MCLYVARRECVCVWCCECSSDDKNRFESKIKQLKNNCRRRRRQRWWPRWTISKLAKRCWLLIFPRQHRPNQPNGKHSEAKKEKNEFALTQYFFAVCVCVTVADDFIHYNSQKFNSKRKKKRKLSNLVRESETCYSIQLQHHENGRDRKKKTKNKNHEKLLATTERLQLKINPQHDRHKGRKRSALGARR